MGYISGTEQEILLLISEVNKYSKRENKRGSNFNTNTNNRNVKKNKVKSKDNIGKPYDDTVGIIPNWEVEPKG